MSDTASGLAEVLRREGHRMTGPRLVVWNVLTDADSHLTVEDIAAQVTTADPTVNLSSVYRSLSLFEELGLVRESNLGAGTASHWELAHPDEQFHLRCVSCGRVQHHTGDLVSQIESHLSDHHGFRSQNVELLVSGLCDRCVP
ncbi:MAG: Fur family transcriptional regulator, partial [Acidimicrobiia bacterium]